MENQKPVIETNGHTVSSQSATEAALRAQLEEAKSTNDRKDAEIRDLKGRRIVTTSQEKLAAKVSEGEAQKLVDAIDAQKSVKDVRKAIYEVADKLAEELTKNSSSDEFKRSYYRDVHISRTSLILGGLLTAGAAGGVAYGTFRYGAKQGHARGLQTAIETQLTAQLSGGPGNQKFTMSMNEPRANSAAAKK